MQQFVWVFCPKRQDEAHKPPLGRDCGNPAFPWPAAGVPFMCTHSAISCYGNPEECTKPEMVFRFTAGHITHRGGSEYLHQRLKSELILIT